MSKCKHADLIMQYAEDCQKYEKPWELWEYYSGEWIVPDDHPRWDGHGTYRRKPKTININGYEVPEPLREEPGEMDAYYGVDINLEVGWYESTWYAHEAKTRALRFGLLHDTKESVVLHAKALLSFTKVDEE